MRRKGMMKGKGRGYKNVIGKDPYVHSQSARGIKQPQKVHFIPEPFGLPRELQEKDKFFSDEKEMEAKPLKDYYRDLRELYDEVTTSDLQGIVYVKAKEIIKKFNLSDDVQSELEDLLLEYASGELDLNSTQRFILELKKKEPKQEQSKNQETELDIIIKDKFKGYDNQRLVDKANKDFQNKKNTDDVDYELARRRKLGLIKTKVGFDTIELIR